MHDLHRGEKNPQGDDKIGRYGWGIKNNPGELCYVDKRELNVDHDYQRNARYKNKILNIARNWNWMSLAALVVARRSDGQLWVVDGQHRLIAAGQRSDVKTLPCIIHDVTDVKKEAAAFLETNAGRKPILSADKHKAALMAGDDTAIRVQGLFDMGGKHIAHTSTTANGIKCIGLMNRLVANNYDELLRIWPLICDLTQDKYCNERIVDGLVYIEKNMPAGRSLTDSRWTKRLLSVGSDELIKAAGEGAAFFSKGGAKPWATGMINRINKGLMHRLEI